MLVEEICVQVRKLSLSYILQTGNNKETVIILCNMKTSEEDTIEVTIVCIFYHYYLFINLLNHVNALRVIKVKIIPKNLPRCKLKNLSEANKLQMKRKWIKKI